MVNYVYKKISFLDKHTLEVLKKSSASIIVKMLGMIAGVGVSIFLGRMLGPEGLGIINLANRVASLLLIVVLVGMPNVIIKEVAIGYEQKNWQHIGNTIATASIVNGTVLIIILLLFLPFIPILTESVFNNIELKYPLYIAVIAIVAQVFSRIFSSGAIGMRRVWQGSLVNGVLSTWVVGIGIIIFRILAIEVSILNVAILYGISRVTVTFSMWLYWKKIFKFRSKWQPMTRKMLRTAFPLLLVSASFLISASSSSIMLGWLTDAKNVGLYEVAARIALLTSFFLQISRSAISPKIASLYAEKKINELEEMLQRVTKGLMVIGFFSFIIFIFGGKWILSLWGVGFEKAYWILVILGFGQLINISTTGVGLLLSMTGGEKVLGRISIISLSLNIVLNFILIKLYDITGAAIATSVSVSVTNFVKYYYAKKHTGISIYNFKRL